MPPVAGEAAAEWENVAGYEIRDELGRGGMGVVYKAWQKDLKRVVALEMILGGAHADVEQVARFRREAKAVARLQHPNIVQIYDIAEHDGLPYLSLEYVDGGSLAQKLAGKPLSLREAAQVAETLARAMHAAHERGIIHRDLKPGNVLLTAEGTPKITDFGLAKQLHEGSRHTQTGAVLGTPSYMAPEQAQGLTRLIGPTTDVYALGAILYEMLTGWPPFRGANRLETLKKVQQEEPIAPRQFQPKVPRDLQTICLKCLRKEQGQRYSSAVALADDLRNFLAGDKIQARSQGVLERSLRWAKLRRELVYVVLGALVVLGLGLLVPKFRDSFKPESDPPSEKDPEARKPAAPNQEKPLPPGVIGMIPIVNGNNIPTAFALSPDGNHVAWGGSDGTVNIQEVVKDSLIRKLKGHQGQVPWVYFSPDGKTLVSAGEDDRILLWDLATVKGTILSEGAAVLHLAISPDDQTLHAFYSDDKVRS